MRTPKKKVASLVSIFQNYNTEILRGAYTAFTLKVIGFIISFLLNIFIAQFYGAMAFGILALSLSIFKITSLFSLIGTRTATVRYMAQYAKYGKTILTKLYKSTLSLILPISLLVGLVLYFSSAWLAQNIFHKVELTQALQFMAFAIPFRSINVINAASFQGLKKIRETFFFQTVYPPLANMLILYILYLLFAKTYLVPIQANCLAVIIGAFISTFIWQNTIKYHTKESPQILDKQEQHKISKKHFLSVAMPMFFSSSILVMMGTIDILILGVFATSNEIGIYRAVLKIVLPINFIITSVSGIASPKFTESFFSNDFSKLKDHALYASKIIFLTSIPVLTVLILFGQFILGFFGEEFQSGITALLFLCVGRFFSSYCGSTGSFLNMTNNQKSFGKILLYSAVLNIVLNIFLIPTYGINGAAVATAASTTMWNLSASIVIYRKFGFWINYFPAVLRKKLG
jgi:O-antigen/teichoic acid export membrane protein